MSNNKKIFIIVISLLVLAALFAPQAVALISNASYPSMAGHPFLFGGWFGSRGSVWVWGWVWAGGGGVCF